MSHNQETQICPNCGFTTSHNYCAQCGQETHLHKETFWGLVMHFVGHYFHYDSKFWQTLKALWFSPGKLTIAYINKQRMRYIPPISLYIFVSAVYFIFAFSKHESTEASEHKEHGKGETIHVASNSHIHAIRSALDSLDADTTVVADGNGKLSAYLATHETKIKEKYGDPNKFISEKMTHNFPKVFFFMIPLMAFMLKLLFARRKTAYFVDHAIFSLHYHSFWFSLFALAMIPMPNVAHNWVTLVMGIISMIYMVMALHKVYQIGWFRSTLTMITLAISYIFFFIVAFVIMIALIVQLA